MKGFILAAGLGSRLMPLTQFRPKPLFLFYNKPLLDIAYSQLKKFCIDGIAVNTHHLSKSIHLHIQNCSNVYTPAPQISHEPILLGTGGAFNPLREWIGNDNIIVYNSDVISDIDYERLIAYHGQSGADATMVLLEKHKLGTTPVYIHNQNVTQFGDKDLGPLPEKWSSHTFSGIHIFGKQLLSYVPSSGFSSIIEAYQALLNDGGRISTWIHSGFWEDLGTPQDYYFAHKKLLISGSRSKLQETLGLENIEWDDFTQSAWCDSLKQSDLASGCFIFGESVYQSPIHNCIVYPGCILNQNLPLTHQIIFPEAELGFGNILE